MNDTQESLDLILDVITSEEPACDFTHSRLSRDCSVHVVSLWVQPCKGKRLLGCANASADRREFIISGGRCATCHQDAGACWREIPV